jgi:hypothetical protein
VVIRGEPCRVCCLFCMATLVKVQQLILEFIIYDKYGIGGVERNKHGFFLTLGIIIELCFEWKQIMKNH